MPRNWKAAGIHTSPNNSGKQNLEPMVESIPKDEDSIMAKILPIHKKGQSNRVAYKGQWTDELLDDSVNDFFIFCDEISIKPTVPLLRLWLGVSKAMLHDWRTKTEKYGRKSEIIGLAYDIMEAYLQANIDKYPTGSTFLLRTTHNHIDSKKVELTTSNSNASLDDINDTIARLGLSK